MKSCLKVAYSKIAVIINAVTLGKTMRPHRLSARTLASHAGKQHPSKVTPTKISLSKQTFRDLVILIMAGKGVA